MYRIRHTDAAPLIGPAGTDWLNWRGEYTSGRGHALHAKVQPACLPLSREPRGGEITDVEKTNEGNDHTCGWQDKW